jgi:plasmid stabilization system protein ParE
VTKIRWTPQASDDLQAIFDFIARDSPHYAQVTAEGILAAIDHLEQFPKLGRRVPESVREDLRELIKPPYRIVYRTGAVVKILTIIHGARQFPPDLK